MKKLTKEQKELVNEYYQERDWLDSWDGCMTSLEWNSRDAALTDYYEKVIKPLLK